jgi:thiol:disulfide interchange protein
MYKLVILLIFIAGLSAGGLSASAAQLDSDANNPAAGLVKFTVENQYDRVAPAAKTAVAINFDVNDGWHFYADAATAPGGMNLKVEANDTSRLFKFGNTIVPGGTLYKDEFTDTTTNVLSGQFTVYLPYAVSTDAAKQKTTINLTIDGSLCSSQQCRMIKLPAQTSISIVPGISMGQPKFKVPLIVQQQRMVISEDNALAGYSTLAALFAAFIAGIVLNIMPCVLPVIPLKVLSIFEQAKESKFRCITLGLAFCLGILVFFAAIAAANIVLRVGYGSVFQWGDHFRNPLFIVGMALLMEVLALIMFGVATVTVGGRLVGAVPKQGGYGGSIGMGFLAALLSTPCSFAILTAAFAWAQTQVLWLSTVAIMVIGLGMAAPYALLTSMPSLLKHLPNPGRWMEIFKQAMGFVLLVVAVWLMTILPPAQQVNILYYAIILAFCVWMWGGWVSYDSPAIKKWSVRITAILIAVVAGWWLLPIRGMTAAQQGTIVSKGITWQPYNTEEIKKAVADDRPVLIEFTADWCLTCKAVEKTVYARKDIQDLLNQKNVLVVRGDTTWEQNPATIALKEIYNEPGVPVTIVYVPGKSEPVRLHGLVIGNELKKTLEEL